MRLEGLNSAVTGGASGLGLASARRLVKEGGFVTLVDLPTSDGERAAAELGENAQFVVADVTDADSFAAALDVADAKAAYEDSCTAPVPAGGCASWTRTARRIPSRIRVRHEAEPHR
jgi:NAD(P)-dependent dehydrogenase (short-subunit alcohol dehydrogenase family)